MLKDHLKIHTKAISHHTDVVTATRKKGFNYFKSVTRNLITSDKKENTVFTFSNMKFPKQKLRS